MNQKPARKARSSRRPAKPRRKAVGAGVRGSARNTLPAPLLAIIDEHKYVSRLLKILEEEAAKIAPRKRADYECMASVMEYMTRYPDLYHHPKEDLVFERMGAGDAATMKAIGQLRAQHLMAAEQGTRLLAALAALRDSAKPAPAPGLREEVLGYCSALREHMALEERAVFAPAARLLTQSDWQQIEREIATVIDPVFGAKKTGRYRDLFSRYLNRSSAMSVGSVPAELFESVAIALEKSANRTARAIRIPRRVASASCAGLRGQAAVLKNVLGTPLGESVAKLGENQRKWEASLRAAVRGEESADNQAPPPEPLSMSSDEDFMTLGERRWEPSGRARISWQAALTNVVFRTTIKQLMARMSTENAHMMQKFGDSYDRPPKGIDSEPVQTGEFRAQWVYPEGARGTTRTVLHLPGGGFIFPAMQAHVRALERLARECGARGMLVHYRLAPEHPFPAGLEDAIAAYRFLLDSGVPASEISVAGDSAGGGLTMSLLLSLRDLGLPMPAAVCVISPLADLSFSTPSRRFNKWADPMLPVHRRNVAYTLYTGETSSKHPLISPVYGSFHDFPPVLAQVSSTEILLDDTLRMARKARAQGVEFEVEVWEGMPHDFQIFTFLPESASAIARIGAFFRRHMDSRLATAA